MTIKKEAVAIRRFDRLGSELHVGDAVAAVQCNQLYIGRITNFSPKMVTISKFGKLNYGEKAKISIYANDMVKVDDAALTLYLLKGAK